MRKRVGISHDPEERRKHWERKYPSLRDWTIIARHLTYEQAQKKEEEYIAKGYEGGLGGEKKSGRVYSVYTFTHN